MHTASISAIILDTVIKATLLLAMAGSVALIIKKRSAATRHMVQTFALIALLLLPFSVMLLPAWHVKGVPGFAISTATANLTPTPVVHRASHTENPVHATDSPAPLGQSETERKSKAPRSAVVAIRPRQQSVATPRAMAATATPTAAPPSLGTATFSTSNSSWLNLWNEYGPRFLMLAWIAGAFFFLARWRLNALRLSGLVRRAGVLTDSGWNAQVRALARELKIHRHVALLVSDELEVPITTGIMFPKIVLSPDYAEWSALRRSAILHHELAHIKRLDALTQALAQTATALYWFHPMVWIMERAMRAERERACDDQVLATGTKASDYAHELLDIVSGLRGPELAAALAMARRSQLEGRVLAVLNPALPRGSVSGKVVAGVAILTLGIVLPLAALRPAPQASTPTAKAPGKQKPSPSSTPATAPRSNDSSAPSAAYDQSKPAVASAPSASTVDDGEARPVVAEAPEAPEPQEPSEISEAPEAPEAPELPGVPGGIHGGVGGGIPGGIGVQAAPAAPGTPAVPGVPGIPAVPAVPAVPAAPGGDLSVCGTRARLHNMSMESHNGYKRWNATWSGDDCNVDLRAEGEVKFNAEATDIQSISSGGFFEVNLRQGDTLKQVKVTPSTSGLQYVYKINGKEEPFQGEAKTWFSQFLLSLERTTGFAADARVPALLAKGGPTAVLDEISNLQSDYVRGVYFRKLLEQPNLPAPVVQRVIKQAGEQMKSDYEMARVLMTVAKQYEMPDEGTRTAFLNAAANLKSDYEHSRVLIELLRRPNISKENVGLAL
ncbi:MAG: M56 family metallopeptidase, partial [Candidatus Angelobacter sp.]